MQKVSKSLSRSKSALLLVIVAAGVSLAIPACKKDDKTSSNAGLSQSDMSDVLTQSISSDQSNSVKVQIDQATTTSLMAINSGRQANPNAKVPSYLSAMCGDSTAVSLPLSGTANGVTFDIALNYYWGVECANDVAKDIRFNYSGHANITTDRYAAKDSVVAWSKISNLDSDSANLAINQYYDNNGSISSKTAAQKSYTSHVHFESTNIMVSKETRIIVSGSAAVTITGETGEGQSFSYQGTIVFGGNKTATFTSSTGVKINLSWN
jgi:hypothetical protein